MTAEGSNTGVAGVGKARCWRWWWWWWCMMLDKNKTLRIRMTSAIWIQFQDTNALTPGTLKWTAQSISAVPIRRHGAAASKHITLLAYSFNQFIYTFIYFFNEKPGIKRSVQQLRHELEIRVGARDGDIFLEELRKGKGNFRKASVGAAAKWLCWSNAKTHNRDTNMTFGTAQQ